MMADSGQVATSDQAAQLRPGDRIVLSDRGPRPTVFGDEVGRGRRPDDPRQSAANPARTVAAQGYGGFGWVPRHAGANTSAAPVFLVLTLARRTASPSA